MSTRATISGKANPELADAELADADLANAELSRPLAPKVGLPLVKLGTQFCLLVLIFGFIGSASVNAFAQSSATSDKSVKESRSALILKLQEKEDLLEGKEGNVLAQATFALSRWSHSNKLRKHAERLLWKTIEANPHHQKARELLGFRQLGAIWLTEDDYQHIHGMVKLDGKWVSKEEYYKEKRKAHTALELTRLKRLFKSIARVKDTTKSKELLTEFRANKRALKNLVLMQNLNNSNARRRQLAVRELGFMGQRKHKSLLTYRAVSDSRRSVRDESIAQLKKWQKEDKKASNPTDSYALSFLPYLSSPDSKLRVKASRALKYFPDTRAIPPLIKRLEMVYSGFGSAYISQMTQRAIVSDYELVSGGTGLVVQEVADPIIDTFRTGAQLEITIRRVEVTSTIAALQQASGQTFGADLAKWKSWWKDEKKKAREIAKLDSQKANRSDKEK